MQHGDWRTQFPRRTVHLDFHVGPAVPELGSAFDPDQFARTFADAHVDSVTVFAKCHHGHLYFTTDRPERHPSLPAGLDLLGEQIAALHEARIRAPIYLSVQCDEYAADHHQDWLALTPALEHVRRPQAGAYEAGWQILDMSSPYQDYLAGQLEEVLERFAPVDGIFLDMCWDQPSSSRWAIEGMRGKRLSPTSAEDREEYARFVASSYMDRFTKLVEPALVPESPVGVWFNSRPKAEITLDSSRLRHIEVEALPTGGWGYSYLPYVGRLARLVGLPALSHTGRFYRSWGDGASLKSEAALTYECCQILMHGLSNGVGDLLPPAGAPSPAVYERISQVFGYIESCEPYLEGGRHLAEIAVLTDPALGDSPTSGVSGAVRALQQLRYQFDIVPVGTEFDLDVYRLLVLPEDTPIDAALVGKLRQYLADGGSLLISASAGVPGQPARELFEQLEIDVKGLWPYDPVFLGTRSDRLSDYKPGLAIRVHGPSFEITGSDQCESLLDLEIPFFQRSFNRFSGHSYTPTAGPSGHPAVLQRGTTIVLAVPLLGAVAADGNPEYLDLLRACIDRLVPDPVLRAGGPRHLETAVVETRERTVVHLLSYLGSQSVDGLYLIDDSFPLADVEVSLRCDDEPDAVWIHPKGTRLVCNYDGQYASVRVDAAGGHALVLFEHNSERGAASGSWPRRVGHLGPSTSVEEDGGSE